MRKLVSFVSFVTLSAACSSQGNSSAIDTSALTGASTTASTTTPPLTPPSVAPTGANPPVVPPSPVTPTAPAPTNADESGTTTTEVVSVDSSEVVTSETPEQVSSIEDQTTAPPGPPCVDVPDAEQSCATRKEWGNCEQQWLIDADYCAKTCGRCTDSSTPPVSTTPNEPDQPDEPDEPDQPPVQDDRFPAFSGGGDGHATRYWDCAKPSCGWSNNAGGHPVRSCDRGGASLGPTEAANGLQGGPAFTCMSWAPWAKDSQLAFGFVASHTNATCGKCYQLQFTGQGQYNDSDPGSVALKDKTMVVMATNIGGDVGGFQFDTLIPGGGVGLNNACDDQQVPFDQQNQNGGLLNRCTSQTDLGARKQCVREQCEQTFSDPKVADLKEGCLWFVDWYNAADNPKFWSKEVPCPQELSSISY